MNRKQVATIGVAVIVVVLSILGWVLLNQQDAIGQTQNKDIIVQANLIINGQPTGFVVAINGTGNVMNADRTVLYTNVHWAVAFNPNIGNAEYLVFVWNE